MKLLPIFVSLICALTFIDNISQQIQQARSGLIQQANSLHEITQEKLSCYFVKIGEMFEKLKNKILKTSAKKPKIENKEDEEMPDFDSTALNELLKKFAEELAKHQQARQEEENEKSTNKESHTTEESHEHSGEKEDIPKNVL